ncbi:MAG: hypothetical protein M3O72_09340, partial [Verrucomicrobiota bacterium]|nr:hypothetical protein [Verrucomicrobiota bacterium]
LEEIAFGCVEGQIADVKTRRSDFDWLRFTRWPRLLLRLLLLLLLTVARLCGWFSCVAAGSKKCGDSLPECFLLWSRRALLLETLATAPSSRPAAPMALASPLLIRVHDDPQY